MICPCQMQQATPRTYDQCCKPFHLGEIPQQPEQLMRSRFSGFVLGLGDYIAHTWHPSTCPQDLNLTPDEQWLKLDIVKAKQNQVHFRAYFKDSDSPSGFSMLDEISDFLQENGRWLYVKGETQFLNVSPNRNDPCLCGSGKKYKKCCINHST